MPAGRVLAELTAPTSHPRRKRVIKPSSRRTSSRMKCSYVSESSGNDTIESLKSSAGQILMPTRRGPQIVITASLTSRAKRQRFSTEPPYSSVRWFEWLGLCQDAVYLCTPGGEFLVWQTYEHRKLWIKYPLHQSISICLGTTDFELELTRAQPIRSHRTLLPWLT